MKTTLTLILLSLMSFTVQAGEIDEVLKNYRGDGDGGYIVSTSKTGYIRVTTFNYVISSSELCTKFNGTNMPDEITSRTPNGLTNSTFCKE